MNLSVLIATYNRAEVLRQTIEAMCALDRDGLDVEFVIIDNNSTDNTSEIIDSFKERLPIRHLFQPRQGKSAALNLALDTIELGDIVVFTDDDVVPRQDWLKQIVDVCERHPDYDVFGGPYSLVWPENVRTPGWVRSGSKCLRFIFSNMDLGDEEFPFPPGAFPAGANTWIRARFCEGHRYNETLGPGDARAHGEDITYTKELIQQGHKALYVGASRIGHVVHPSLFDKKEARKRAFKRGRMMPNFAGLSGPSLFKRFPLLWLALRLLSILRHTLSAIIFSIPLPTDRLFLKSIDSLWRLGINVEQFSIAWNKYWRPSAK